MTSVQSIPSLLDIKFSPAAVPGYAGDYAPVRPRPRPRSRQGLCGDGPWDLAAARQGPVGPSWDPFVRRDRLYDFHDRRPNLVEPPRQQIPAKPSPAPVHRSNSDYVHQSYALSRNSVRNPGRNTQPAQPRQPLTQTSSDRSSMIRFNAVSRLKETGNEPPPKRIRHEAKSKSSTRVSSALGAIDNRATSSASSNRMASTEVSRVTSTTLSSSGGSTRATKAAQTPSSTRVTLVEVSTLQPAQKLISAPAEVSPSSRSSGDLASVPSGSGVAVVNVVKAPPTRPSETLSKRKPQESTVPTDFKSVEIPSDTSELTSNALCTLKDAYGSTSPQDEDQSHVLIPSEDEGSSALRKQIDHICHPFVHISPLIETSNASTVSSAVASENTDRLQESNNSLLSSRSKPVPEKNYDLIQRPGKDCNVGRDATSSAPEKDVSSGTIEVASTGNCSVVAKADSAIRRSSGDGKLEAKEKKRCDPNLKSSQSSDSTKSKSKRRGSSCDRTSNAPEVPKGTGQRTENIPKASSKSPFIGSSSGLPKTAREKVVAYEKGKKDPKKPESSSEERQYLQPKFDKNFRIPKKPATLPNPLLEPTVSTTNTNVAKTPSTWLQTPSSKPTTAHAQVPKVLLRRGARIEGSESGWRILQGDDQQAGRQPSKEKRSDDQKLLGVLDGSVPFTMAEEVANARQQDNSSNKNTGKRKEHSSHSKHSNHASKAREKEVKRNENEKNRKEDSKRKHDSRSEGHKSRKGMYESESSRRKSREKRRRRTIDDDDDEWTPSGCRRSRSRSRSRTSSPPSHSPVGVAGRTRSRTRSRSPHRSSLNVSGFSGRISDSESEIEENVRRLCVSNLTTSAERQQVVNCSPAARSCLSSCLQDTQLKKALFASSDSNAMPSLLQEQPAHELVDRDASTPPLPITRDTLEEPSAQIPGLLTPTSPLPQLSPAHVINVLPQDETTQQSKRRISRGASLDSPNEMRLSPTSTPCPPSAARAVEELTPNTSSTSTSENSPDHELLVLDNVPNDASQYDDAEEIDLEPEERSYKEMFNRLDAGVRYHLDIMYDNLKLAFRSVDIYIDDVNFAEKQLTARDSKIETRCTIQKTFKELFNKYYSKINSAQSKVVPSALSLKDLHLILQKRWSFLNESDKNIQEELEDMDILHKVVNGDSAAVIENNSRTAFTIAAGLFNIDKKKYYIKPRPQTSRQPERPRERSESSTGSRETKLVRLPPLSRPVKHENARVENVAASRLPGATRRDKGHTSSSPRV